MSRSGLTLIELLIAISVVGILSSLSMNAYTRSQAKSRQAEAKVALSGVYTAQKAFYSEYSAYYPDLGRIGYTPEGFKRFYQVGWATPVFSGTISGYSGGASGIIIYGRANIPAALNTWPGGCAGQTAASSSPMDTDNPQGFTVMASAYLILGNDCDQWTINELKRISNTSDGLK